MGVLVAIVGVRRPAALSNAEHASRYFPQLMRDIRFYKAVLIREEGTCDAVTLASKLANVGYRVSIRTAIGGGAGTTCFQNLSHNFLVVYGDLDDVEYIIETNFREVRLYTR